MGGVWVNWRLTVPAIVCECVRENAVLSRLAHVHVRVLASDRKREGFFEGQFFFMQA